MFVPPALRERNGGGEGKERERTSFTQLPLRQMPLPPLVKTARAGGENETAANAACFVNWLKSGMTKSTHKYLAGGESEKNEKRKRGEGGRALA